jgi:maleylpyruvate isomerase
MLTLYTYFRSSAAYRVRIALGLKRLDWQAVPVHLVRGGGEQFAPEFKRLNPSAAVPVLCDEATVVTQSLAICEYLEEVFPLPPLLPADAGGRARVRSLALAVACDIHPLNNLRVLRYLKHTLHVDDAARDVWYRHWVGEGLQTLETRLAGETATGSFCHGETPTLADCFVVPQLYNAERYAVDLAPFPTLRRIQAACNALPAFIDAHPARQVDAE